MDNPISFFIFLAGVIYGLRWLYLIFRNVAEIVRLHLGIKQYKKERDALKGLL